MFISSDFTHLQMRPDGSDWEPGEGRAPGRDYRVYREYGWFNAWWLFPGHDLTEAQIERLVRESEMVYGGLFHHMSPEGQEAVLRVMKRHPQKMCLLPIGEIDNHVDWSAHQDYFCTRAAAADYYLNYILNYKVIKPGRSLEQACYSALGGKSIAEVWREGLPEWLRIGLHIDGLCGVHLLYEKGCHFLMIERSSSNTNYQLAVAFLRGGARQYGRTWGMHMSPWNGGVHREGRGPTAYDELGRHVAGNSAELLQRHWITSYLSGAHDCHQEAPDCTHWSLADPARFGASNVDFDGTFYRPPDRRVTGLSPVGEAASKFADFCLRRHPDAGGPYVPAAVMLPHCHGWNGGGRWLQPRQVWGGKVPYGLGDYMVENIFDFFLPGYRVSGRGRLASWNPEVDWESEHEYLERMYAGKIDARVYERGLFTATPYGDCIDVLTDHASLEVLQKYSLVILAGEIEVSGDLLCRLKEYAVSGGTVFLNFNHLYNTAQRRCQTDEIEKFAGLHIISNCIQACHPCSCHICGAKVSEGALEMPLVDTAGAEVLVSGQSGDATSRMMREKHYGDGYDGKSPADPLVTGNKVGEGRVVVSLPHFGLCHESMKLAGSVRHVLDHLIKPLLKVEIDGSPIQYHTNMYGEHGCLVGLVNSTAHLWQGKVLLKTFAGKKVRVRDIWNEAGISSRVENGIHCFSARIDPFGFGVYRVEQEE